MTERNEMFDEMLNDCYDHPTLAGITFYPADILAECDPIAYRVMLNDWQDAQCSDGLHSYTVGAIYCDFCGEKIADTEEDGE